MVILDANINRYDDAVFDLAHLNVGLSETPVVACAGSSSVIAAGKPVVKLNVAEYPLSPAGLLALTRQ